MMTRVLHRWPGSPSLSRTGRGDQWLLALGLVLAGYALLGKGFAYLGLPPLFIGEIIVLSGTACFLTLRRWRDVLALTPIQWLIAFMAWGMVTTLPYLPRYGFDTLRDAVLWGYGLIAIAVAGVLISQPRRVGVLVHAYHRFIPWLIGCLPMLWMIDKLWSDRLPTWPWAPEVQVVLLKGGDCLVHLAGVLAFWAVGLAGRVPAWQMVTLAATAIALGTTNRGGLLSFLLVGAVCFVLRPRSGTLRSLVVGSLAVFLVVAATNVSLPVPGRDREISAWQFIENIVSIATSEGEGDLQGTKQWRLLWWGDIIDYTFLGDHFWAGKGFGINLADDDGYQVNADDSLRSPHNAHLTILARMGVPGLAIWMMLLGSWTWTMWRTYLLSRSRGDRRWSGVLLFLLAYGTACLVNATFDVYLEGPMGGIWFWTIFGTGLAASWCYRHAPDVFDDAAITATDPITSPHAPRRLPAE